MLPPDPRFSGAEFLLSVADLRRLPPDRGREVAFVGRSNSGKSTTLNAVAGQRGLARTAKLPGRTQLVNFFTLGSDRRLVDLPGYGYAQASDATRTAWNQLIDGYLRTRRSLGGLVLVMDIRHPLQPFDEQVIEWCRNVDLKVLAVLNKADKLSRRAAANATSAVQLELGAGIGEALTLSALRGQGVSELRDRVANWLQLNPPANRARV